MFGFHSSRGHLAPIIPRETLTTWRPPAIANFYILLQEPFVSQISQIHFCYVSRSIGKENLRSDYVIVDSQGMDQEQAQKQYMEILRSWPGYGSTLFDVEVM